MVAAIAIAIVCGSCARRRMGPNDAYQDPRVAAEAWRQLFEGDDREIYRKRDLIMKLAAPKPGMTVADVGAGTGLFTMMLSDAVGPQGRVYAEEVLPKFSYFIAERAAREKRNNVVSVMGTDTGIGLPPDSIDLVFACDVYHHFDHPQEMLASIRLALRGNGELFLVDFSRIPGLSPAWLLEHVRAGEAEVVQEIENAGFALLSRDHDIGVNYALRFRRSKDVAR
ncbi:MAG TPA: methyltransferase [Thermoanaerobaculia bacterium]